MQSRIVVIVLAVVALLIGSRHTASAQQTESRIIGTITDPNGGSLPGVAVTVTSTSTGAVRSAVTDEQGRFVVTNLAPGTYHVAMELNGFAATRRDVTLGLGDVKPVDVRLALAGVTEAVTVAAEATTLDIESARIGVNVSPAEIEQLPVNGRNFANLMTLATGATTDGNGGRPIHCSRSRRSPPRPISVSTRSRSAPITGSATANLSTLACSTVTARWTRPTGRSRRAGCWRPSSR